MADLPDVFMMDREGVATPPDSPLEDSDGSCSEPPLMERLRARRAVFAELVGDWSSHPMCAPEVRAYINSFENPEDAVNWMTARLLVQPVAPSPSMSAGANHGGHQVPTSAAAADSPLAPSALPHPQVPVLQALPSLTHLMPTSMPAQFAEATAGQGVAAPTATAITVPAATTDTLTEKELSEFRKVLNHPGQFDHTKSNISAYDWLSAWKTYLLTARWSQTHWVSMVSTHLRGLSADLWTQHAKSLNSLPSWTEFCTWLQTISGQRLTPEKARENLGKLKQTGHMSDFLAQWNAEYYRLTSELRPDTYTTIHILLHDAITPVIRKRLFPRLGGGHYTDLTEFLNLLAVEGQEMETAQARAKSGVPNGQFTGFAGSNLGVNRTNMKRTGHGHGRGQARSSGHKASGNPAPTVPGRATGSLHLKLGPQTDKLGNLYPHLSDRAFSYFVKNNMCIACTKKGHRATDMDGNGKPVCEFRGKAKPQIRALQQWLNANEHLLQEN